MLKTCLRDPIPEIYEAARRLDAAVSAHLDGNKAAADELIRLADDPAITEWTESLWGRGGPWTRPVRVNEPAPFLPRDQRVALRMPSATDTSALLARDGFHCRFCGIPLIRAEIRSLIFAAYPEALRWGSRNADQHAGFQAMWLQYDHLLPHARGGTNARDNMLVTCAPCNNGRSNLTLEEAGLADPRLRPPNRSCWDGLERFRPTGSNISGYCRSLIPGVALSVPSTATPSTVPQSVSPFVTGSQTHRFWWTWIPALPLNREDKWYRVLETVFADHTIHCIHKTGRWAGFYTQGTEQHQTVGVFHSFSALTSLWWLEQLLSLCEVPFTAPIRSVRWQYELQSRYTNFKGEGHADIALRIIDSRGEADEFVVVFEAKRKRGALKQKDIVTPDHYSDLRAFSGFRRINSLLLINDSDTGNASTLRHVSWQQIARLQIRAFERLEVGENIRTILIWVIQRHLADFDLIKPPAEIGLNEDLVLAAALQCAEPRLAVVLRGAWTTIQSRRGNDVSLL